MSRKKNKKTDMASSCEGILALLKASQRQLEYLAHEHLSFEQVLRLEQGLRVGSSPERAEIQRMRLLLDARLDHVRQMRALTSLAPLTFIPSEKERIQELQSLQSFIKPYEADESPADSNRDQPHAIQSKPIAANSEPTPDLDPKAIAPEPEPEVQADTLQIQSPPEQHVGIEKPQESEPEAGKVPPKTESNFEVESPEPIAPNEAQEQASDNESTDSSGSPADPIPLAAAPIALGSSETEPSQSGLSIQILPSTAETAVERSPSNVLDEQLKDLMRKATKAHSDGEIERAIEAYSDLLDRADDHAPTLLARGRCHLEKKDFGAAVSDFRRAQRLLPNDPGPLVALGDLFFARKDHDSAIAYFDGAIALQTDHPQARCRRGLAHYHGGRYRQAFLDLQRAYKLDPEIPNIRRLVQMAIRKLEESP